MPLCSRQFRVLLAACAVALLAPLVHAQDAPPVPCSYSVLQIQPWSCGGFPPMPPTPLHLNNHGHWVGYVTSCTVSVYYPIKWTPQTGMVALPIPPGDPNGHATGINDSGLAVGHVGGHSIVWPPEGGYRLLPLGAGSEGRAVNNAGTIAGMKWSGSHWHGFVLEGDHVVDINPEEYGLPPTHVRVMDLSEAGHVAGYMGAKGYDRGFRWKDGKMEVLQPLPGAVACRAVAVNSSGVAVGDSRFLQEDGVTHSHYRPTLWIGTEAVALPLLPHYSSGSTRDISDEGIVVGSSATPTMPGLPGVVRALWFGLGAPQPLVPLVQTPQWGGFGIPYAINDVGQILASGGTPPMGVPFTVYSGVWILTPQFVPGDVTHDCVVDGADLAALLEAWGPVRRSPEPADLNGDGRVNGADLGMLLASWTSG